MCGIVGYISNNDKLYQGPKEHFMRYALALDTLRGEDSTGIITLNKRFTVKTLKTTMPGDRFVHSPEYSKKFNPGWAQIGHNRAATRGGVSVENAHPFSFGDVTMVHNGTLFAGGRSLDTYDERLGKVDSMQIAYALSQYPPEEAGKVLSQIDGSFALVWTDRRDESVNLVRNVERPLHFTYNSAKTVLWFMSDGHHLHSINKSFGNHECRGDSIYELDKHKIMKYKKGCTKPEVKSFAPYVFKRTAGAGASKGATTTGGTKTPGKPGAALERAAAKWNKEVKGDSTSTPTSGSMSDVKVEIQGRKRSIPKIMQRALEKEMYVSPKDELQFQPDEAMILPNGRYVVYGTMWHPSWDMTWDMTLYDVQKVQWRAYKDCDWLVRAIGITHPHKFDRKNCAVLGKLIHCSWDSHASNKKALEGKKDEDDDKEVDSPGKSLALVAPHRSGDILVPGPNGRMMEWSKLSAMLDAGCINCGMELMELETDKYLEVNSGQDLLCVACQIDVQNGLHTIN